jgi:hypothetical protein
VLRKVTRNQSSEQTDRIIYLGDAYVAGTGFWAGERVQLQVVHSDGISENGCGPRSLVDGG